MRLPTPFPALAATLVASILVSACVEGSDPTRSRATAMVAGVVTATSGAAVAGASVTIGTASTITGAEGRFELRDVPVGTATILTSARRFDPRAESIAVVAGTTAHDVVLTPQTLFTSGEVVAYLPPGVAGVRVALVFLPGLRDPATGQPLDSRGLVRGIEGGMCSIWCSTAERAEVRRRSLELAGGNVALVGTTTLVEQPSSYETMLRALSELASESGHPELANVPILFVGHSMGGCTAYGFSRVHGARVAGFVTMKGACHDTSPAVGAAAVPGFFLIGGVDAPFRRDNITAVFQAGRATGGPWALSTDAFDHRPMMDMDLMFTWMDAVLAARLPATAGGSLRAVPEADGWLGNRSSGAIATYACYGGVRASASWLPSREAALGWQRMAGGSAVVGDC